MRLRKLKRNWPLAMLAALLLLLVIGALGCSSDVSRPLQAFQGGDFVTLCLTGQRAQVCRVQYMGGINRYIVRTQGESGPVTIGMYGFELEEEK